MNIPQQTEQEALREICQSPRQNPAVPIFREGVRYADLPDWSLVGLAEVALLTRTSKSKLERMIINGQFEPPRRHGNNRVWSLGYIRQWCTAVAARPHDRRAGAHDRRADAEDGQ